MKDAKMDLKRIPVYILFILMPLLTALLAFGGPLGYYGYNGGHAAIGTFGAWGPFMVWAMSPVAAVTGMELLTPVYTNLLFSCLANFFFLLFTRPSFRSTLKMLLASCFFYTSFNYILTSMSESTRFSLGIVLAAPAGAPLYSFLYFLLYPLCPRGARMVPVSGQAADGRQRQGKTFLVPLCPPVPVPVPGRDRGMLLYPNEDQRFL